MTVEELYQKVDRLVGDGHGPLKVMIELADGAVAGAQVDIAAIGDAPDDGVIWMEPER